MNEPKFFTVSVATPKAPKHYLVRAENALDAMKHIMDNKKEHIIATHITEYAEYFDTIQEPENEEKAS